jgi:hypothetical protein
MQRPQPIVGSTLDMRLFTRHLREMPVFGLQTTTECPEPIVTMEVLGHQPQSYIHRMPVIHTAYIDIHGMPAIMLTAKL